MSAMLADNLKTQKINIKKVDLLLEMLKAKIYLEKPLNKATISDLESWNVFFELASTVESEPSVLPEKSIFKAVPSASVCTLPQSRHLSQPTQSIILVMLRNFDLNCSLR